jgi:phenylacetate-CoA ligase
VVDGRPVGGAKIAEESSLLNALYEAAVKNLFFPAYEGLVKGRGTHRYLKEYERSQWLTPGQIEEIRLEKLNKLVDHCWKNVPHLCRWWRENGLQPGLLQSVKDLERFPVITKKQIQTNYDDMVAGNWRGRTMSKVTGGSTGDPFQFEYTVESYARRTAVMIRGYRWAGADLGRKALYVWGVAQYKSRLAEWKDRFYNGIYRRSYLNCFRMEETRLDEYLAGLEGLRPEMVIGYVTPTLLLAERIKETGRAVPPIRGIITGAEPLYQPQRELLEAAFKAPVFNTYGCREVMMIAGECPRHAGLHVNADHLVVETVDSNGRQLVGESGDVTLTDLHNYGMPLVRYQNGDRATLSTNGCSCGRGLPLMQSIEGRVLDLIKTPDGRLVPGEFFVYVMLGFPQVRGYQVVQTKADELEIRVLNGSMVLSPDDRTRMEEVARRSVGQTMNIAIKDVDQILPSPSGKRRIIIALGH